MSPKKKNKAEKKALKQAKILKDNARRDLQACISLLPIGSGLCSNIPHLCHFDDSTETDHDRRLQRGCGAVWCSVATLIGFVWSARGTGGSPSGRGEAT